MDTIVKFKEAALALQQDERYAALQQARKANDEDTALQEKIGQFNLLRIDVDNERSKDEKDGPRIIQLNKELNNLYNEIMSAPTMVAYNKAKEEIESFIEYVNAVLNAAIDGQDPMQVEEPVPAEACGGSCSSCAGCH